MVTTTQSGEMVVAVSPATKRRRLYWTIGNLMLIGGVYLLLYVGGLYTQAEFHRMAARGDSDIETPRVLMNQGVASPDFSVPPAQVQAAPARPAGMAAFEAPVLNNGQIASALPNAAAAAHVSTVERIVLPTIKVDSKVIEVGWEMVEQNGQQAAVWQVAEYAVGQHRGSANPGEGGNIVLAGHVGGYGKVFRDLYYVRPGEPVVLYSDGQQFLYTVKERLVLTEEGVSAEQRAENAKLIEPTDTEVVTMVTCWPLTGPDKFKQRVIIRAVPFEAAAPPVADVAPQTVR